MHCCPSVQYFVIDIVTNSHNVQYCPGVQYCPSGVVPIFRVVPVDVSVVLTGQFCTDVTAQDQQSNLVESARGPLGPTF